VGLPAGLAAGAFEAAELFFVAADVGGDGFEDAAQLADLDGESGQGGGVASAVLVDDGATPSGRSPGRSVATLCC